MFKRNFIFEFVYKQVMINSGNKNVHSLRSYNFVVSAFKDNFFYFEVYHDFH